MAFPDFSEFSFGYSIVRQIEDAWLGHQAVPTFPTQHEEANAGYDVDFLSHGVPLFIQFKRSEVMQRRSCKEWKDPSVAWRLPIYRMHLHKRFGYRQHMLLRALERAGNTAIYCTSSVPTKANLDHFYSNGRVFDAAAVFWPSDIRLPSLHDDHHVAFNRPSPRAYVYSDRGSVFEPRSPTFEDLLRILRSRIETPVDEELGRLTSLVDSVGVLGADEVANRERRAWQEQAGEDVTDAARAGLEYDENASTQVISTAAIEGGRRDRIARLSKIESVVRRAALIAYYEMDAFLISVPKDVLQK